jgi:glycosyltransferase involved in cell wall biosynthesis
MSATPVERPTRSVKLAYLVSHPIQYQAPLLRRLAQEADIDLTVFFCSDFSLRSYADKGFGVGVQWDVPLVDGYRHEFLPALPFLGKETPNPLNFGIFSRLKGRDGARPFDALWLHGYSSASAIQALLAAKVLGIPVLLRAEPWLKDRPRGPAKLWLKRLLFHGLKRLVAGVLPIGTRNCVYWRHYLGDELPHWRVPYAVDNGYFEGRSHAAAVGRAALQAELDLDPARPVILFASKLQSRKRCMDLLEAYLALAPASGDEPHPYLVLVGDGEERPALERRAAASGLTSIRFCGFRNQSELPRFFDLATVFVLPSQHEPWGLIVNEVMNAGKPVILADDVGCHPDLLTDGVEGYLFPTGDVASLTACLQKVLAEPDTAARMGHNARRRIQPWNFDADIRGLRQALAATTGRIFPCTKAERKPNL